MAAPFLPCKAHLTPGVLRFWLIRPGLMKNSERLGSGQRKAGLEEFDVGVAGWLPLLREISLTGEVLSDVVLRNGAAAGCLDGGN